MRRGGELGGESAAGESGGEGSGPSGGGGVGGGSDVPQQEPPLPFDTPTPPRRLGYAFRQGTAAGTPSAPATGQLRRRTEDAGEAGGGSAQNWLVVAASAAPPGPPAIAEANAPAPGAAREAQEEVTREEAEPVAVSVAAVAGDGSASPSATVAQPLPVEQGLAADERQAAEAARAAPLTPVAGAVTTAEAAQDGGWAEEVAGEEGEEGGGEDYIPLASDGGASVLASPIYPLLPLSVSLPLTVQSGEGEREDYILLANDGGASMPASAAAAPAVVHKPADTDSLAVKERYIHCKCVARRFLAPSNNTPSTALHHLRTAVASCDVPCVNSSTLPSYCVFPSPLLFFQPSPVSPFPPPHAIPPPTPQCHHPSMPPTHHLPVCEALLPCPHHRHPFDGTPPPASSSRLLRCPLRLSGSCDYVERRYQAPATDNTLTALHHLRAAVASCDVRSAFRLLVTAPVDVNADVVRAVASTAPAGPGTTRGGAGRTGQRLLHVACERGDEAMVELLLLWGAVVNVVDSEGRTPMQVALQHGNHGCSKLLASRCVESTFEDSQE
ncbi:unnamed protein product [Closterium sp. Naga37s-1]|nr:unnamed protein product [Closterium sp. Naga37s-1]